MHADLLKPEIQKFIHQHESDDERAIVLGQKSIHGVPSALIADQIAGRRKAREKLPTYFQAKDILYPPGVNLEQTSSEKTARYKADIILRQRAGHLSLTDLTGGLGVDTFFLSRIFERTVYVERDPLLLALAQHNHKVLGADNITYQNASAEAFLQGMSEKADWVFIDPSRRTTASTKAVRLADCEPDVARLQSAILAKSDFLLIKASPLLDIRQGLGELSHVKEVYVISVDNECKELLFLCRTGFEGEPQIVAVHLQPSGPSEFRFTLSEEKRAVSVFSQPLRYLYEPNTSLTKAGAFRITGSRYALFKIHPSTHLYTSTELLSDFPGRIFEIRDIIKSDSGAAARAFPDKKANVITRNYPLSSHELKKKLKLKDGSENYLLAFSGQAAKYLCVTTRVSDVRY
ncbi:MAG TPA: SAM-dependent methyltransferase [Ohtaekwangia sp.]|nr:SAM-dependent methyltransferase [Ohtaekwangia sp.]